ncbi:hypothetical protein GPECTOR_58g588 [Gonium pectorale]|uniref:HYR domain-containing protein n=1 Tax=Gonium pectorale TaxID=33097 RepID=A0A150G5I1_GONPE|nr:hypothetical protein GPECTOR_58g588 [Gonium pectorale]|eukprot:KXZ45139.1 hypothetical protein GPECTOR_58g588 [Gonium pectorale]
MSLLPPAAELKGVCTTGANAAGIETGFDTGVGLADCRQNCAARSNCTFIVYSGAWDVKGTLVSAVRVASKANCMDQCTALGWSCTHFTFASTIPGTAPNCFLKVDMLRGTYGNTAPSIGLETCAKVAAKPDVCSLSPCGQPGSFTACTPGSAADWSTWNCTCAAGFYLDAKEKKCVPSSCASADKPCGANGVCKAVSSIEYSCTCKAGFFFDTVAKTCLENKCAAIVNPCGAKTAVLSCNPTSTNVNGALTPDYNCDMCAVSPSPCGTPDMYDTCTSVNGTSYVCGCKAAYFFDTKRKATCVTDRCAESPSPCGVISAFSRCLANSTNSWGYTCTCRPGYEFKAASGSCERNPIGSTDYNCTCTRRYFYHEATKTCLHDITPPVLSTPTLIVAEAVTSQGTEITFTPRVSDNQPGEVTSSCTPQSGSRFPISKAGSSGTLVVCTATDAAKNTVTRSFRIKVVDTTPPVFDEVPNLVFESADPAGKDVAFKDLLKYGDDVSGATVACTRDPVGSFFPVGEPTKGACAAVGATAGGGTSTCVANGDGTITAVDSTPVSCTATDGYGNKAVRNFTVTIIKPTPPVFTFAPANVVVDAEDAVGAVVQYTRPTAVDAMSPTGTDGPRTGTVSCWPDSGSKFGIGTTLVTCTAKDKLQLEASVTFTVTVTCTWTSAYVGPNPDGTPFDDTAIAAGGLYPISRIEATAGSYLDGVRVTYLGSNATSVWRGGAAGLFGLSNVSLQAGETITKVEVGYEDLLTSITLTTSLGRTLEAKASTTATTTSQAGNPPAAPTCAPKGSNARLVAIKGRYSASTALNSLAFVWCWDAPPALFLPDDISVEAPDSTGAAVSYMVATTNDAEYQCVPASGSTFKVGRTTVRCTVARGDEGSFYVNVEPPTPPVFSPSVLPDVAVTATTAQGVAVEFPPFTVTDAMSGPPLVTCDPPSNSFFPNGETQVKCTAVDRVGLSAVAVFKVTVARNQNFVDPTLSVPASKVVEAFPGTEGEGRSVTYDVTASIDVPFTCNPPSGAVFPLGQTPVECYVDGYTTSYGFVVEVRAAEPPFFNPLPAHIASDANQPLGATVKFDATAQDDLSGISNIECNPPSGSTFPYGVTTVVCVATDGVGLQANASFTVTVSNPCASPVSPCGLSGTYVEGSCTNIKDSAGNAFDFSCDCQSGFLKDANGACSSTSDDATPIATFTGYCLEASSAGSLTQQACSKTSYQSYNLIATGGNAYAICNSAYGELRCLTASYDIAMVARDPEGAPEQRFYIRPAGNTGYTLTPMQQPTKCLVVAGDDYAGLALADCPKAGVAVPVKQIFVLPIDSGIGMHGRDAANPNWQSLMGFKAVFKDMVVSTWNTARTPLDQDAVAVLTGSVAGYPVEFGDATANHRHLQRRQRLQEQQGAAMVPVVVNVAVTWPLSVYPPDEAQLGEALFAQVSSHFDSSKPMIRADSAMVTVSVSGTTSAVAVNLPTVEGKDAFYGSVPVSCSRLSGDLFAIGTTNVMCKAVDGSGNYATLGITVEVKEEAPQATTTVFTSGDTCLEAAADGSVTQRTCANNQLRQSFDLYKTGDSAYALCVTLDATVRCITVGANGGVALADRDGNGAPSQLFYPRPAGADTRQERYTLTPIQQPTKCLALESLTDGASLILSDCAKAGDVVPAEQTFALPIVGGLSSSGTVDLPYAATLETTTVTVDANGKPDPASVSTFVLDFKGTVASQVSSEGTAVSPADVTILGVTINGVDVDISALTAAASDGAATSRRRHLQQGKVSVAVRFTVALPLAVKPPNEAKLAQPFGATVTTFVDKISPIITASATSLTVVSPAAVAIRLPTVTATDNFYPNPTITCTPPSGSMFPVGVTNVVCKATDGSGNYATVGIAVTVRRGTACAKGPGYVWDESKNVLGRCSVDCQCAGSRVCGTTGFCQDASGSCPVFQGFVFTANKDHQGDDIGKGASLSEAFSKCQADCNCKSFNTAFSYKSKGDVTVTGWQTSSPCVGLYVRSSTCNVVVGCPEKAGFLLFSDKNHVKAAGTFDEQYSAAEAESRCRSNASCTLFNSGGYIHYGAVSSFYAYGGLCSYLKQGCPEKAGFLLFSDKNYVSAAGTFDEHYSAAEAESRCRSNASCTLFNSGGYIHYGAVSSFYAYGGLCSYLKQVDFCAGNPCATNAAPTATCTVVTTANEGANNRTFPRYTCACPAGTSATQQPNGGSLVCYGTAGATQAPILTSTANLKCLDITGGVQAVGTFIQQYGCNGSISQQFAVKYAGRPGVYSIVSTAGLCVKAASAGYAARILLATCDAAATDQLFTFQQYGSSAGRYTISPTNAPRMCLDVEGVSPNNGAALQLWSCNYGLAQVFNLDLPGSPAGAFFIKTTYGMCFKVEAASTASGARIALDLCKASAAEQKFVFKQVGATTGRYTVSPSHATGKCLDVGSSAANAALKLSDCSSGSLSQIFAVNLPATQPGCVRPFGWCSGPFDVLKYLDCDGDSRTDLACLGAEGYARGTVLSTQGCVSVWPSANISSCPAAFDGCPRGLDGKTCTTTGQKANYVDCDGDGKLDWTCMAADGLYTMTVKNSCNAAGPVTSPAVECSKRPDCRAFNTGYKGEFTSGWLKATADFVATTNTEVCHYVKLGCTPPAGWCNDRVYTEKYLDCDGDGAQDAVCMSPDGYKETYLSGSNCTNVKWASEASCPAAFGCPRAGFCTNATYWGDMATNVDVDGDGRLDWTCVNKYGQRWLKLSTDNCNIGNAASWLSPTLFGCPRGNGWCGGTSDTLMQLDCDGDSILDYACMTEGGAKATLRSTATCAYDWPLAPVSSCSAAFQGCIRPRNWCKGLGETAKSLDCDGDKLMDWTCASVNGSRGAILSSQGCTAVWPSAPVESCPAAFGCARPSGWCVMASGVAKALDCDGDGRLDWTCTSSNGFKGTLLSTQNCASVWPAAPESSCPALFGCPRGDFCINAAYGDTAMNTDCDGDGKLDWTCYNRYGQTYVKLSSEGCVAKQALPDICLGGFGCPRPDYFCSGANSYQHSVDCDGDGRLDWACLDTSGAMSVVLSGQDCTWITAASAAHCPAAFAGCPRGPDGMFCTNAAMGDKATNVDCDGDGKLDWACVNKLGVRYTLLSSNFCNFGANVSVGTCPAAFADACNSNKCAANGVPGATCSPLGSFSYWCNCPDGSYAAGDTCYPHPCTANPNPCVTEGVAGATCVPANNGSSAYSCSCPAGSWNIENKCYGCPAIPGYDVYPANDGPLNIYYNKVSNPVVECNKRAECRAFNLGFKGDFTAGWLKPTSDRNPTAATDNCLYVKQGCARPDGWCPPFTGTAKTLDCDGDGKQDWVCMGADGFKATMLSKQNCASVTAPASACPAAFGCERPANWCTNTTYWGDAAMNVDVDGDGKLDWTCSNRYNNRWVILSSNNCAISNAPAGIDPALFGCPRTGNWCWITQTASNIDCDGDGRLDWTCMDESGQRGTILSSEGCARAWPLQPISSCPAAFNGCLRPINWCVGEGDVAKNLDCDGDGRMDWTCANDNGARGAILSRQGCAAVWPSAPINSCPAVFGCEKPSDWCIQQSGFAKSLDCDGDGRLDWVCVSDNGNKWTMLSSNNCSSVWVNATSTSGCPALFGCPRGNWCTATGLTARNIDCDGDGKLDWTCTGSFGERFAMLSSNGCQIKQVDTAMCPGAFGCDRGTNWCTNAANGDTPNYVDCDGDGKMDWTCVNQWGVRFTKLYSAGCAVANNVPASACPLAFGSGCAGNPCTAKGVTGATCTPIFSAGYWCNCPAGSYSYDGTCYPDPCAGNPCAQQGVPKATCNVVRNGTAVYTCSCPAGTSYEVVQASGYRSCYPSRHDLNSGYLGCFVETPASRRLPNTLLDNNGALTPELCRQAAVAAGYPYFGVHYGAWCYGGVDLGRAVFFGASEQCNMACAGDKTQACGGNGAISVYSTTNEFWSNAPADYVGCFGDGPDRRMDKIYDFPDSTAVMCRAWATWRGYRYYGLQSGQCSGSNNPVKAMYGIPGGNYGSGQKTSEGKVATCSGACQDGTNCGGTYANAIYDSGYLGCYKDAESRRMAELLENNAVISTERCRFLAIAKGYAYYGLQNGNECWGSSDLDKTDNCGRYPGDDRFTFTLVGTNPSRYSISPRHAPTKCLDIAGGSSAVGAALQLWECNANNNAQTFKLTLPNSSSSLSGYRYFALQYDACFASNDKGKAIYGGVGSVGSLNNNYQGTAAVCDAKCPDGSGCGGSWSNELYDSGYIGCFKDSLDRRLSVWAESSASMTPDRCRKAALQRGYPYYAIQFGYACFLESDLAKATSFGSSSQCNTACTGDSGLICGGPFSNSLYIATN